MSTAGKRPWDGIISEDEQKAYQAAGFGRASGLGKRPALLIIDVQYRTVGTTVGRALILKSSRVVFHGAAAELASHPDRWSWF